MSHTFAFGINQPVYDVPFKSEWRKDMERRQAEEAIRFVPKAARPKRTQPHRELKQQSIPCAECGRGSLTGVCYTCRRIDTRPRKTGACAAGCGRRSIGEFCYRCKPKAAVQRTLCACGAVLRASTNKSGMCGKCYDRHRSQMGREPRPTCKAPGCTNLLYPRNTTGYCLTTHRSESRSALRKMQAGRG